MRRLNLIIVLVLLAVPATAAAKIGVDFGQDPQTIKPGERQDMTVSVFREPGDSDGALVAPVGERPLVTFTNVKTGEVVRVRAGRTSAEGLAKATVTFPSRGEWRLDIGGIRGLIDEGPQSLPIGIPISDLAGSGPLPPEIVEPPPAEANGGFPALPLGIGLGFVLLAAASLLALRRRQEGAA